jgi:uncharacterized glyoxalase superfamily protein PhnB
MRVEPYLMFAGRCEEALAFYRRAIDAQPLMVLRFNADSEAQARRSFDALAEGGSVVMPLQPTFWSPCFGMCSDRFGVHWMVGLDGPQA